MQNRVERSANVVLRPRHSVGGFLQGPVQVGNDRCHLVELRSSPLLERVGEPPERLFDHPAGVGRPVAAKPLDGRDEAFELRGQPARDLVFERLFDREDQVGVETFQLDRGAPRLIELIQRHSFRRDAFQAGLDGSDPPVQRKMQPSRRPTFDDDEPHRTRYSGNGRQERKRRPVQQPLERCRDLTRIA